MNWKAAFSATTVIVTAFGIAGSTTASAHAEEIVVSGYGGLWEKAFRTCFEKPYHDATGNTVAITVGSPTQWINQIKAASGRPPIDLLMIPSSGALEAIDDGIVEKIDETKVPNYKDIAPRFRDFSKGMGAVYVYGAMGLSYNKDTVKNPPKTWKEFVDGTIAGKWRASIPGLDYGSSGIASTVWMLANVSGGSVDKADAGFDDIKRMKESGNLVFWNNANDFLNQLGSGDADLGMYWDGRSWAYTDDGHPNIQYVNPQPGSVAAMTWVQKVKGSPDTAWKLMDYVLSAEGQSCYGNMMRYGMTNQKVTYDPAVAPVISKLDEVIIPPFDAIAKAMPTWVDRWNREIK